MTLSEWASLFGVIFGLTGAIMGALGYYRDRAKVVAVLQWDIQTNLTKYSSKKYWGMVTITNAGRRPVYIQDVALLLPKKYDSALLLFDNPTGLQKIGEGDSPVIYIIDQDSLAEYSRHWRKIYAGVKLSTGKTFHSKKVSKKKIPSWVKDSQKGNK
jgi:hypothetical protein